MEVAERRRRTIRTADPARVNSERSGCDAASDGNPHLPSVCVSETGQRPNVGYPYRTTPWTMIPDRSTPGSGLTRPAGALPRSGTVPTLSSPLTHDRTGPSGRIPTAEPNAATAGHAPLNGPSPANRVPDLTGQYTEEATRVSDIDAPADDLIGHHTGVAARRGPRTTWAPPAWTRPASPVAGRRPDVLVRALGDVVGFGVLPLAT
jgi:hypothetical protein